jgi:uncharacterized protein with HEPN domain
MAKDPTMYLRDVLESCDRIIANLKDVTLENFRENITLQDAVIRRFEIIGEATKRLSDEVKDAHPHVPWKYAAGFRDVLIHDYPEIVMDQVYLTGKDQLPEFREQVAAVLRDLQK